MSCKRNHGREIYVNAGCPKSIYRHRKKYPDCQWTVNGRGGQVKYATDDARRRARKEQLKAADKTFKAKKKQSLNRTVKNQTETVNPVK